MHCWKQTSPQRTSIFHLGHGVIEESDDSSPPVYAVRVFCSARTHGEFLAMACERTRFPIESLANSGRNLLRSHVNTYMRAWPLYIFFHQIPWHSNVGKFRFEHCSAFRVALNTNRNLCSSCHGTDCLTSLGRNHGSQREEFATVGGRFLC
jgi:hypothetical protein